MELVIISPEKTLFQGEVSLVQVPGKKGQFTVLNNHAPIISSLGKGSVVYRTAEGEQSVEIASGLIEVCRNVVTVCVE